MAINIPRLILVGAGFWGKRWLKAAQEYTDCRLAAVVAGSSVTLDGICSDFGVSQDICFTDYNKAFKEVDADAVVVVVPSAMHMEVQLAAMEAGLHVLSEKPIAADWESAVRVYTAWHCREQLHFMVAQTRRWSNGIGAMKRFLESGRLGRIGMVNMDYRTHRNLLGWRLELEYPLLEDMSMHHFDIVRYLTGCEPVNIFCRSFKTPWEWFQGFSAASAVLSMTNDVVFSYLGCWTTQGRETTPEGDITIVGENGSIELLGDDSLFFYPQGGSPEPVPITEIPSTYIDHALREFCTSLEEDRRPECCITDNLKTFASVCAAIRSSETGRPVDVSTLLEQLAE